MKNKIARHIYIAIKSGCKTYQEIIDKVTVSLSYIYISDGYIKSIANDMRRKGYILGHKNPKLLHFVIMKKLDGPIDLKL